MTAATAQEFLPVELVFNPNWWYQTAGISFDEAFYCDAETRIQNDVTMRRVLYERYGDLGLGEPDPLPRPIIGSLHVAGGFVQHVSANTTIMFQPLLAAGDQVDGYMIFKNIDRIMMADMIHQGIR